MKTFDEFTLKEAITKQWGEDSQHLNLYNKMRRELETSGCDIQEADPPLAKPKREYCRGCEDEYYHSNRDEGCWSFKTAKLILRKKVSIDQVPPWNQEAEPYLNCYNVKRFIFVRPDQVR